MLAQLSSLAWFHLSNALALPVSVRIYLDQMHGGTHANTLHLVHTSARLARGILGPVRAGPPGIPNTQLLCNKILGLNVLLQQRVPIIL